jgi:hypothetical protein
MDGLEESREQGQRQVVVSSLDLDLHYICRF